MKNTIKIFGIIAFIALIGFSMIGCDMENTGFQLEWYKITSETYNNRPTGVSAGEQLSYVKNSTGTGSKNTFWSSNYNQLEEKLLEVSGALSISSELKAAIQGNYETTAYSSPGLWNIFSDYWFFYIENNNNK